MPIIDVLDSKGQRINYLAMNQRPHNFDCRGVCGRKELVSFAPNAKYCQQRLCQAKREADAVARRKRRDGVKRAIDN